MKRMTAFAVVIVLGMTIPSWAGQSGWIWTSAPSSATVGDTLTVSAYYKKPSTGTTYNASFSFAGDASGNYVSGMPSTSVISESNGTMQFKITSRGNGVLYVFAGASGASASDCIRISVSSPSYTSTVTFNKQGGSGGTTSVIATFGSAMPSITVPSRKGYTFEGYYEEIGGAGTKYYSASGSSVRSWEYTTDQTLYANWTANTYTITFDTEGGSGGTTSAMATYEAVFPSITIPSRTGYSFGGYYTEPDGSGSQYYSASGESDFIWREISDRTLYAKWTAETCSITFSAEGGSGGTASQTATYDSDMPPITVPQRPGYTFEGYYSAENGGGKQYYTATGTSANVCDKTGFLTLYAKWSPAQYTITFDPNGGTLSSDESTRTAIYHEELPDCIPTPTRGGHVLVGWVEPGDETILWYDAEGTKLLPAYTATVSVSLLAVWQSLPSTPVITPADGTIISGPTSVIMSCAAEDAIIHYTTDGTDPTGDSPVYRRFRVSGRTTVKAIAVMDGLCSEMAVAEYALGRCSNPEITAQATFTGSKTSVTISCATSEATIHYTLDGSEPNSHAKRYIEPFDVTNSCTVKAYATYPDYFDSEVVPFAIEKVWGIGDTLGAPDQAFTTGGDAPFIRVTDATAPLGEAMQSGAITHNQTSTMTTTVMGPGTVSFQWRTSCEEDPDGWFEWDHAEFNVDGAVVANLDGVTAWQTVSQAIAGDGAHTLVWRYVKDNVASAGDDCCRVANYRWASAYTATQTTGVSVPYVWLRKCFPAIADEYEAYESAATATAANGVDKVWECYVAGISPTSEAARFEARVEFDADGDPVVKWTPDLNEDGTKHERVYTVIGKTNLTDKAWGPTNEATRFFRVKVSMPE